jgi:hypothetical protein
MSDHAQDREVQLRVAACKQRLRWQLTLNPAWLAPLLDEAPILVRDVATVYDPDAEDPVRAPGLSHFMRAIHLTAEDLANFLQTHRLGRLIDVSTHTLWKSWARSQRIVGTNASKPCISGTDTPTLGMIRHAQSSRFYGTVRHGCG